MEIYQVVRWQGEAAKWQVVATFQDKGDAEKAKGEKGNAFIFTDDVFVCKICGDWPALKLGAGALCPVCLSIHGRVENLLAGRQRVLATQCEANMAINTGETTLGEWEKLLGELGIVYQRGMAFGLPALKFGDYPALIDGAGRLLRLQEGGWAPALPLWWAGDIIAHLARAEEQ